MDKRYFSIRLESEDKMKEFVISRIKKMDNYKEEKRFTPFYFFNEKYKLYDYIEYDFEKEIGKKPKLIDKTKLGETFVCYYDYFDILSEKFKSLYTHIKKQT